CAVLAALVSRDRAVPPAILTFFAALPWCVGLASMRVGMAFVMRAVDDADYASRAPMLARGLSEALSGRVIGAALTGALAVGVGLALAISSRARPDRTRVEALASAALALTIGWVGVVAAYTSTETSGLYYAISNAAPIDRIDLLEDSVRHSDLGGT